MYMYHEIVNMYTQGQLNRISRIYHGADNSCRIGSRRRRARSQMPALTSRQPAAGGGPHEVSVAQPPTAPFSPFVRAHRGGAPPVISGGGREKRKQTNS
eukprot:SAG22_NODE_16_length_32723_cov_26.404825_18_plen_99_part_00